MQTPPESSPTQQANTKHTRRKSWFSLNRRERTKQEKSTAPPSAFNQDILSISSRSPSERLRPIQFSPNRIATLYVTPSERNLYLAAMAQLDEPPKPLPLWAEPPPNIPALPLSPPIEINRRMYASSTNVHPHPLTTRPFSPKLVTSPGLPFPGAGLQIRDEFRNGNACSPPSRHALLSLEPNAFMRFTGFPATVLLAVDQAVQEHWGPGIILRSDRVEVLQRNAAIGGEVTYGLELHGNVWKKKGSEELDSIRLVLAILTTLGVHGWTRVDTLQASGSRKDSHNLLFAYSPEFQQVPPAFFALSLPLPDRLSIISAPSKITPAILNAVRNAITANAHLTKHWRAGTGDSGVTANSQITSRPVTWGKEGKGQGIKLEGWVHHGVYRFWVSGMRRWLGGAVKQKRIDNLHPLLLITIINNLSALHTSLVGSIPMLPLAKGRDVLYFSTLPSSGLSYLDSYVPGLGRPDTAGSESPVIVSPAASLPPAEHRPVAPHPRERTDETPDNEEPAASSGRRILPWTSMLDEGPPEPRSRRNRSSDQSTAHPPPSAMPTEFHERSISQSSSQPLIGSRANFSAPRHRNVLSKKNSLRRERSVSGNDSIDMPVMHAPDPSGNDEEWSMIDVPAPAGRSAAAQPGETQVYQQSMETRTRKLSNDTASVASIYQDTEDTLPAPPTDFQRSQEIDPYPQESEAAQALDPMYAEDRSVHDVPIRDASSPRRARSALVDVGSGLGIPSMHGSVGFFQSQSMVSGAGRESRLPMPEPISPGFGGSKAATPASGQYRLLELGRVVQAESAPPPVPAKPEGQVPDGMDSGSSTGRVGTARTRVSIIKGKGKEKSTY